MSNVKRLEFNQRQSGQSVKSAFFVTIIISIAG